MPSGKDPYLQHDEENQTIEIGYCDWYEECTVYASGDNDYTNYIQIFKVNYIEFLELWFSKKLTEWEEIFTNVFTVQCDRFEIPKIDGELLCCVIPDDRPKNPYYTYMGKAHITNCCKTTKGYKHRKPIFYKTYKG